MLLAVFVVLAEKFGLEAILGAFLVAKMTLKLAGVNWDADATRRG